MSEVLVPQRSLASSLGSHDSGRFYHRVRLEGFILSCQGAHSTPSGHPAHQHPVICSKPIRPGSRSAATQVCIVSLKPLLPSISSRACASIRPSVRCGKRCVPVGRGSYRPRSDRRSARAICPPASGWLSVERFPYRSSSSSSMSRRCAAVNGARPQSSRISRSVFVAGHQLGEAAVTMGQAQFFHQARHAQVVHALAVPTGLVRWRASQPGFANAGGAADGQG